MNTQTDFAKTYESMSDGQLLQIANEGGLVDEAKQILAEELHRRNLEPGDLPRHKETLRTRLRREATERKLPSRTGPTGFVFFGRHYLTPSRQGSQYSTPNQMDRCKWPSSRPPRVLPLQMQATKLEVFPLDRPSRHQSSPAQLGSSVSHLAQGIAFLYLDPRTPLCMDEVSIVTKPTVKL
jgi:hypothetical protein